MRRGALGFLYYLDDFLFVGPPQSNMVNCSLDIALRTVQELGFPSAPHKTVRSTTRLVFLGIVIDSEAGTLSLPQEKLDKLRESLSAWGDRKAAPKRELLSLIGHLSHAATVVPPGRAFVRHLINTSSQASALHHFVRLNRSCRADILWWTEFGLSWSGTSIWPAGEPTVTCCSDASGSWGCGAVMLQPPHLWFQLKWPCSWSSIHIAAKELVPMVVAAAVWGHLWHGKRVLFKSDNQAAVSALLSGSARDPSLAHLLRCFFFFSASWQFSYTAAHITGSHNTVADALSRDRASSLPQLFPEANPYPSRIPASLQDLLLDRDVCWTSRRWRESFSRFMRRDCLVARHEPTTLANAASSSSAPPLA